ncbi:MAG: Na/Pi symporter [Flavobacteriaceae bacterium]|nr:Na/Pi symporter [Flavobacteriaceae bacterium]
MDFWMILNSLGAIALFLFGMKIMSDGIQLAAGLRLRKFLNSMTNTKLRAVLAGLGLTAVIQSSSAVSVLTLSFVNAGLLRLISAFGIIIGANIGTTIKLWIIALGFEINFSNLSLAIIAIAVPLYFLQKLKMRHWATFLIGFALIFIGLDFLSQNLSILAKENFMYEIFKDKDHLSYFNGLLFLLSGLIITVLVQSSSASTSIFLVLYSLGFPLEACAMMIIGANIGTTVTAQIAAYVGNTYAKFTAHFHTLFNIFGAVVFFFISGPLILWLDNIFGDKYLIIAAFHSIFNVVTAILIFPFLEKIVSWFRKKNVKNIQSLQMMHSAISITPEIYIYEANNLLGTFAGNIKQSVNYLGRMITESDPEKLLELHERIIQLEKEGDAMEGQIKQYLNQLYEMDLSGKNSQKIHYLISVSTELENIGDLAIKSSHTHLLRRQSNSFITPKLRTLLIQIQDVVSSATTHLIQNLNETENDPKLTIPKKFESEINQLHHLAFDALMAVTEKHKIKPISAMYYRELIQNYEIIGDHIFKANKALIK